VYINIGARKKRQSEESLRLLLQDLLNECDVEGESEDLNPTIPVPTVLSPTSQPSNQPSILGI